jgi:hypothetical protein
MVLEITVVKPAAKAAVIVTTVAVTALLTFAILVNFIVGVITDERVSVSRDLLADAVAYAPNSASLLARLAAAEMREEERDLSSAENYCTRAVRISPWDYRHRLLLALIKEAEGDRVGAEQSLGDALALAPNYKDVHWRMANLLLREGKLAKSVAEFRAATSSDVSLLPATLDLLWRASEGNLAVVEAVTGKDPKSRLALAQFLLKQSKTSEAVAEFDAIERNALEPSESSAFINALMADGHLAEARELWVGLVGDDSRESGSVGVWNGGFESEISRVLGQFDWAISRNVYVVPGIDASVARSGQRSLRLDFLGRDTTQMDGQVKQVIVVHPGARYRLEYFVKAQGLATPQGPRVVLTDGTSSMEIASSDPVAAGSYDWRRVTVEFAAPPNARAVWLTIRRVPRFSYDDPTLGALWFDDFTLSEQARIK